MNEIKFNRLTLEWKDGRYHEVPKKSGVYQIYGTSPLYGMDTLLYIGKSHNLKKRIKDHFDSKESFIGRQPNKSFRFAEIEDTNILNSVEQILIIMHKPSFNSASLIKVTSGFTKNYLYIQNHGERGMLNIEVTNFYFINKTDPFSLEES